MVTEELLRDPLMACLLHEEVWPAAILKMGRCDRDRDGEDEGAMKPAAMKMHRR
ncbi:hypothetical protein Syun_028548 [Stephania yunnanensis]|uniref:Uncharacterized protein n=1 Tax=Stephania yunnanensis TaxID=152371 RepID=A0AAP0EKZ2_9MAGN